MSTEHIADVVRQTCGLSPRQDWNETIQAWLSQAVSTRDLPLDCVPHRLLQLPELRRELAGRLTVSESYFLRHGPQFDLLANDGMARLERGANLVCCSLGCCRGEEPYSMAIALHLVQPHSIPRRVQILGCDIAAESIRAALDGRYSSWSLRDVPPRILETYFREVGEGQFELAASIRALVALRHLSLQEFLATLPNASLDVVFFRNVGIYFEPKALAQTWREIRRVVKPDGWVAAAPADPRPDPSLFAASAEGVHGVLEPVNAATGRSPSRLAASSLTRRIRVSQPRREGVVPRLASASVDRAPSGLAQVKMLGDRGDLPLALAAADRHIREHGNDLDGFLVRGQLRLAATHYADAVDDFRRCVFLDSAHWVARFWYAHALWMEGCFEHGRRQAHELIRQLAERDPGAPAGPEVSVGELLMAANRLREELL